MRRLHRSWVPDLTYDLLYELFTYLPKEDPVSGEEITTPHYDEERWLVEPRVVDQASNLVNHFLLRVGPRWAELEDAYDGQNNRGFLLDLYLQKAGYGVGFHDRDFIPEDLREHLVAVAEACPRFEVQLTYHDTDESIDELHLYAA